MSLVADSEGLAHHAMKLRLVNLDPGAAGPEHVRLVFVAAAADDATPEKLIQFLAAATVHDNLRRGNVGCFGSASGEIARGGSLGIGSIGYHQPKD